MQARRASTQDRPRAPGLVYAALAVALLLVVTIASFTARQPPPPSVAEFAPQAVEQITEPQAGQTSSALRGGPCDVRMNSQCEGAGQAQGEGRAPEDLQAIDVPRVRRCVGDPPRQIEDAQSPPCVPYWQGDNGGATSKGVTRDEIRVVFPGDEDERVLAFTAFFNRRFELYGRKIIVSFHPRGENDAASTVADAVAIDTEDDPFAVVGGGEEREVDPFLFYDELASRKIIAVHNTGNEIGTMTEARLAERHPYQWSYLPGYDSIGDSKGAWACSALAGRPARYAGPALASQTRRFGIIHGEKADGSKPATEHIKSALARCGVRVVAEASEAEGAGSNAVIQMQSANVTTVFQEWDGGITAAATTQSYYPEWLVGPLGNYDTDLGGSLNTPEQWQHAFGTTWWNKTLTIDQMPWYWAAKEGNSDLEFNAQSFENLWAQWSYHPFLVLAAGIQMAGPALTPDTFARGLQATRFPNPSAGDAPWYQAFIGFADDHTAQDDASLIWWNTAEPSPWGDAPGTYCFRDFGARHATERRSWPSDDSRFFAGACR